jgi:glycerol-3-phosphate acyltransferase PlsY
MRLFLLIGALAYLLGSIPFGLILMRVFRQQDIRSQGSGNIGATNVLRSGGKGLGAAVFLLDAAKGFVAVKVAFLIAQHFQLDRSTAQNMAATAALAAILGHIYTVWLRFKGGKGVATGFGVFLAISPLAALAGLAMFALVFAFSRYVSLGSILGAAVFAGMAVVRGRGVSTPFMLLVCVLIPALVIVKHHANIRRLLSGTEYRFGRSKAAAV